MGGGLDVGVAILQNREIISPKNYKMGTGERQKWLKWSKIGICVPLKDRCKRKRDTHVRYIFYANKTTRSPIYRVENAV